MARRRPSKNPRRKSKPAAPKRAQRRKAAPKRSASPKTVSKKRGPAKPASGRSTTPQSRGEEAALRAKFELGPADWTHVIDAREKAQTIPWGYGRDKVAAMAVDPDRLFIYWEVTDEAIVRARAELGPAGDDAWLDLRVHDVTGRLFDGTNSHHFFDVGVARADRQWFVNVDRPGSTVVVELGLLARGGAFAKIARSHRADFPRRDPPPPGAQGAIEWLTVRAFAAGGRAELTFDAAAPSGGSSGGGDGGRAAPPHDGRAAHAESWLAGAPWFTTAPADFEEHRLESRSEELFREWLRTDFWQSQWEFSGSAWEWVGPVFEERWESGTQAAEVSTPALAVATETQEGGITVERRGVLTRVRQGPWRVEIRGLDAKGGGRVIARWELRRAWVGASGRERWDVHAWLRRALSGGARAGGASEQLGASERLSLGASERRWLLGSEARLGGASELRWLGASERRLRGASEQRLLGASERRLRGASERRLRGASERRLAGASERRLAGASERRLAGGSEKRIGGGFSAPASP
jgi:hypothetical protein